MTPKKELRLHSREEQMQVAQARILLEDLKKRTMEEENNPYDCSWDAAAEILLVSL